MNTKLTLTIEQEIINRAKLYAKAKNRSLSDIIENYLKLITIDNPNESGQDIDASVKVLQGSFKEPKDFDYKNELSNRREDKYL